MRNILKVLPFLISAIIIALMVPNPYKNYRKGKKAPGTVYAPFDFVVEKTADELRKDSLRVVSNVYPVVIYKELPVEIPDTLPPMRRALLERIRDYMKEGIISDKDFEELLNDPAPKVKLYVGGMSFVENKRNLLRYSDAYNDLYESFSTAYPDSSEVIKLIILDNLKPTFEYDRFTTQRNREEALKTISRIKEKVVRGELIVKKSQVIDEETYRKIIIISSRHRSVFHFLFFIFLFGIWGAVMLMGRSTSTWSSIFLSNASLILNSGAQFLVINYAGLDYLFSLTPMFVMLIHLLATRGLVQNFVIMMGIILGVYYGISFDPVAYTILLGITTLIFMDVISRRYDILWGLIVFPVSGIVYYLIIHMMHVPELHLMVKDFVGLFVSSTLSVIGVALAMPAMERLIRLTTKFNLYDYASLNHPLLRELREKAPGTYNHSLNVAFLAEEAAKAIGADPLLCRVGSYYHDVGKIHNPSYFVENQQGYNPHDELSPIESARIIIDHVPRGVELANKHNLPNRIIDIIKTHHGTTLLKPFYKKALEMGLNVDESQFRYPGPKPRTNEEGIVMLADSVEAAVRSLPEKDPNIIRNVVHKIIEERWDEGQLEETDLKKKDLHTIEEAFLKVLSSIYHTRVPYD